MPGMPPIGKLTHVHGPVMSLPAIQLEGGENVLGRAAASTPADVNRTVPTTDTRMSRRHVTITVRMRADRRYTYLLTNVAVDNPVRLYNGANQELVVERDDQVYLDPGYRLKLGTTTLKLEIPAVPKPTKVR